MDIKLGDYNKLEVLKEVDFGVYLYAGEEIDEILLPQRYVPEGTQVGDQLEVFLYLDSEERLIATTQKPYVKVGEFASLEVAWVNEFGAFLNWGLMKDLFVPFREQKSKMKIGNRYVVYCYLDEATYRIVATAKVERYLSHQVTDLNEGDEVEAIVWEKTNLGYKVLVNHKYAGLIYANEVFQHLSIGDTVKAYLTKIREDGKLDIALQKPGFEKIDDFSMRLLNYIKTNRGFIPVTDKSPAEEIYALFSVSKKTFKKAVGDLYKRRLIVLQNDGISLAETD